MVWEHLIASDSGGMFLAAHGIWVTDWMTGAKKFCFLSVDSDRVVLGSVSPLRGVGAGGATCDLVFLSQGTAVY